MTALRTTPSFSLGVSGLWFCATLICGCLGRPGGGPAIGWQDHDTATLTLSTDDADQQRGGAGSGEDPGMADTDIGDDEPAAMDDPESKPPIAERRSTSDDSVRCGNGVLDDGELCEIGIPDGDDGACVTDCGDDPCSKLDVHGCMTSCVADTTDPRCPQHPGETDEGSKD